MVYRGTIRSGGVVLPADVTLPDGTEVLVALPDQSTGPAAWPAVRESLAGVGRPEASPSDWPQRPVATPGPCGDRRSGHAGPAEMAPGDPVADFLAPAEYAWNADVYVAELAVRAYLDDSHADH